MSFRLKKASTVGVCPLGLRTNAVGVCLLGLKGQRSWCPELDCCELFSRLLPCRRSAFACAGTWRSHASVPQTSFSLLLIQLMAGALSWIRTSDLRIRSPLLYPTELPGLSFFAELKGQRSWSGRLDSNQRLPQPHCGALPG